MNRTEKTPERRVDLIRTISLVLSNEFLFCLLYLLHDYNRPVTLVKLAKDLRVEDLLLRDNLNILVGYKFVIKEGERYKITNDAIVGINFTRQAIGSASHQSHVVINTDLYSEIILPEPTAGTLVTRSESEDEIGEMADPVILLDVERQNHIANTVEVARINSQIETAANAT